MVNNTEQLVFSSQQKTALTLLGYKRWVLRCTVGKEHLSPVAVSPVKSESKHIVLNTTESVIAQDSNYIFPLVKTKASLWISRNYTVLYGDALPYYWLLPSLWMTGKRLVLFADEQERKLWLAALTAVELALEYEMFLNIFQSEIPLKSIPDIALINFNHNITAKKIVAVCTTPVNSALLNEDKSVHKILHPLVVLRQVQKKRILWQQLLALKEKIY